MNFIQVFTGPMRCGKSEMLLEKYNRYRIAKKNIILFKPIIDVRTPQLIATRNGKEEKAIEVNSIKEIYDNVVNSKNIDAIFIDEFQFLNDSIQPLLILADSGIKIYISGLNLTAERIPFGSMPQLLSIATKIDNLTAVCENCLQQNAIYTFCKQKKDKEILVGDSEYIPLCSECYNKLVKQRDTI